MDMAVANLFKHKIRLDLIEERIDLLILRTRFFERKQYYRFQIIENVESISLRDLYSLYTNFYKSFILYAISKALHETRNVCRDGITISIGVYDLEEGEGYELFWHRYDLIWEFPGWFSDYLEREIVVNRPDHLVRGYFYPWINVSTTHIFNTVLEEARFRSEFNYTGYWRHPVSFEVLLNTYNNEVPNEEEYTPPTKTYRQDCCVICLEAKPNILYLDCMHIAICDSCDPLKKTDRKNCKVCRAEISRRIAL